jgi:hypothetical protein
MNPQNECAVAAAGVLLSNSPHFGVVRESMVNAIPL